MTIITLLVLLIPNRWHCITGKPIQSPNTCMSAYSREMAACATQYPDATSLARRTCDAAASGRYSACMGWLP